MKIVLKVLLLAVFAIVVFMPMNKIAIWAYWSMFFLMFGLLYLYYRFTYWVSLSDVETVVTSPIKFSVFCGKVPPITSEDLVRGRLAVTDSEVILFQRNQDKNSTERIKNVWSVPIEEIEKFSIGRVVGVRNGLIISLVDGNQGLFAIFFMKNKKESLTKALGWS